MNKSKQIEVPIKSLSFKELQPGMKVLVYTGVFFQDKILSISINHANMHMVKMESGVSINKNTTIVYPDNKEMKTYFLLSEQSYISNDWFL
jgi:hypothetical protein